MPWKDLEARRKYNREYQREWYKKNRDLHIRRVYVSTSKRRALLLQRINELRDRPCADCGVRYPPYVMDFDHIVGEKVDDVCAMRRRMMDWDKIVAEIAKCDVVCSNCHRPRTYFRRLGEEPPGTVLSGLLGDGFITISVPSSPSREV
jgi:hypothetical protein